jgi:hypothetical protein
MLSSKRVIGPIIALVASTAALPQSAVDKAFTATGAECNQITWSEASLAKYPRIASACQGVMERDGKYYVKFSGAVRQVADRGRRLTVDFNDGSRMEVEPPENTSVYINGRPQRTSSLRRGDELTFYVPQDMLAENAVVIPPPTGIAMTIIPITSVRVAQAPPAETPVAQLPATAGALPLLGLLGLALTGAGAVLTMWRLRLTQPR